MSLKSIHRLKLNVQAGNRYMDRNDIYRLELNIQLEWNLVCSYTCLMSPPQILVNPFVHISSVPCFISLSCVPLPLRPYTKGILYLQWAMRASPLQVLEFTCVSRLFKNYLAVKFLELNFITMRNMRKSQISFADTGKAHIPYPQRNF